MDEKWKACLKFEGREFFKELPEAQVFQAMLLEVKEGSADLRREGRSFIVEYSFSFHVSMDDLKAIIAKQKNQRC